MDMLSYSGRNSATMNAKNKQWNSTSSMQALADEMKDPFESSDNLAQISDSSASPNFRFPQTQFTAGVDRSVFKVRDPEIGRETDQHWDHTRRLDALISEFTESPTQ